MSRTASRSANVLGERLRHRREQLGLSQEKVGVAIGIDESSSRARISRYELGVHEPPVKTARLLAEALGVPMAYLYCDDDDVARLLLALTELTATQRRQVIAGFLADLK